MKGRRAHHLHRTQIVVGPDRIPVGRTLNLTGAYEMVLGLTPQSATIVGASLHAGADEETLIGYDAAIRTVFVDRSRSGRSPDATFLGGATAPVTSRTTSVRLRIVVDRTSVEVFVNDGEPVLTDQIFPAAGSNGVDLFAIGGTATVSTLAVWELKSSTARSVPKRN